MHQIFLRTLTVLFLVTSLTINGQSKNSIPNSIVDIGIGVGANYGLIGVKTLIGYKGSGLFIAAGTFGKLLTYDIGVQLSYQNFYANLNYGTYGVASYSWKKSDRFNSLMVLGGWKFGLGESKQFFVDAGIGYVVDQGGITGNLGINYRINYDGGSGGSTNKGEWYTD